MNDNNKRLWFILTVAFILGVAIIYKTEYRLDFPHREMETIGQADIGVGGITWTTVTDSSIALDSSNNLHINWPGITVYIECENVKVVWDTLKLEER